MKTLEQAVQYLQNVSAPTTIMEIASRLLEQAEYTHMIGMAILEQAETLEGMKQSKRRDDGLKMLRASKTAFTEAAKMLEPFEAADRVNEVLKIAYEYGYEISYQIGKRVYLERVDAFGERVPVEHDSRVPKMIDLLDS